jgi:primase-polymerase (primpol)-like protein
MKVRKCAWSKCRKPLPVMARSDMWYCSTACRVARHRSREVIPVDMRRLPRWVRWNRRKIPLTVTGETASSTNEATWSTYPQTRKAAVGWGMGFVLNGDGIVCLDLDNCLSEGVPSDVARELIDLAGGTYVEVSPSGRGLHIWGRAALSQGRCVIWRGQSVEIYPDGRYMTVTRVRLNDQPSVLNNVSTLIDRVLGGE